MEDSKLRLVKPHLAKTSKVRLTMKNWHRDLPLGQEVSSEFEDLPITKDVVFGFKLRRMSDNYFKLSFAFDNESEDDEDIRFYSKFTLLKVEETPKGIQEHVISCFDNVYTMYLTHPAVQPLHFFEHPVRIPKGAIARGDTLDVTLVISEAPGTEINLEWNIATQEEKLKILYNDNQFKDIKFLIGDEIVKAHKAILANKSPVFRSMFTLNTRERQECIVKIQDAKPNVFKEFIKYLYVAEIDNFKEVGLDLLVLADKYDVKGLKDRCENGLSKLLSKENAVFHVIKADEFNCQKLKRNALVVAKYYLNQCRDFKELYYTYPHLMDEFFDQFADQEEEESSGGPSAKKRKC